VYEGKWAHKEVAIKVLHGCTSELAIAALQSLHPHPNIVSFHGHVHERFSTFIIMELVKGASLYQLIHEEKNVPSTKHRFQWMKDIAMGMEYLHSNNVLHGDLKSQNVLINSINQAAKLIDFGGIHLINRKKSDPIGTMRWMAPDVLGGSTRDINKTADVYSYSMILVELVTLQIPFHNDLSDVSVAMKVVQGERPTLPSPGPECPPYLHRLITTCWDTNPRARPSFEKIRSTLDTKTFP